MSGPRFSSGRQSAAFAGGVGVSTPASRVSASDYLMAPDRFPSEGNWAFCRFKSDDVPAIRLGFQRGGFNIGPVERTPSPAYLQLHLEAMTREGALLWVPSGRYNANDIASDPHAMDITLAPDGREIFRMCGWPKIACHFRSDDGDLEVNLRFELKSVSVLPDCLLPHCVFAMWESMGDARGDVRYQDRTVSLDGKVFFDHTRVIERRHTVSPRKMYVYTTLYLEDGSCMFGYYSTDARGQPIDDYCFCVYLDSAGNCRLLCDTVLTTLVLDEDGIATSWQITWRDSALSLGAVVTVQRSQILRSWGCLVRRRRAGTTALSRWYWTPQCKSRERVH